MIEEIYQNLFPEEKYFIYQSYPSIRIQFFNNVVVPPHFDADDIGKHPLGEKNFIIPITKMSKTNTIFIESEPRKEDYKGIDLEYGELFFFNGNLCTHYNMKNQEQDIRISLDFRVVPTADYFKYINSNMLTTTNPRDPDKSRKAIKMTVGNYYQIYRRNSTESIMDWYYHSNVTLQTRPNFDNNEAVACYDYLKSGDNFITEFKQTEILENMLANYIGVKHCIMTTSGHMALYLSLLGLGIGINDEVIVPDYTMIATINVIKMVGAKPVIVDVDASTYTISIDNIKQGLTDKTRVVLHVSLNNRDCNLYEISEYCKQNNLLLVEDAAQSLGCLSFFWCRILWYIR